MLYGESAVAIQAVIIIVPVNESEGSRHSLPEILYFYFLRRSHLHVHINLLAHNFTNNLTNPDHE